MQKGGGGECGYFLLGNVITAGDTIVVSANNSLFNVTPPPSGELWVTVPGRATDIRVGDDVRVSLAAATPPYRATVINLYRRDEAEPEKPARGKKVADAAKPGEGSTGEPVTVEQKKPATRPKAGERAKPEPRTDSTVDKKATASPGERHFRLGLNLLKNGKREAAIESFDKAREADSSEAMAERISRALEGKSAETPEPSADK